MIIVTACRYPEYSNFEVKSFLCKRSMPFSIYGVILFNIFSIINEYEHVTASKQWALISTILMKSLLFRKVALQLALILFFPQHHVHVMGMLTI